MNPLRRHSALLKRPEPTRPSLPQPQRAVAAVRVTNADVDAVELKFYPKLTITGRVLIDDSGLSTLSGADTIKSVSPVVLGCFRTGSKRDAGCGGRFSTGNLLPRLSRGCATCRQGVFLVDAARLAIVMYPPTSSGYLRHASMNGISGSARKVEELMALSWIQFRKPIPNAIIVLVPVDESNRPDRYKTATARGVGRFQIEGIAPGDYTAFSWEALEDNSWFDPNVVRQFESKGKLVHVVATLNQELQLTQIPAASN